MSNESVAPSQLLDFIWCVFQSLAGEDQQPRHHTGARGKGRISDILDQSLQFSKHCFREYFGF